MNDEGEMSANTWHGVRILNNSAESQINAVKDLLDTLRCVNRATAITLNQEQY